jgi:hypothetical protein
MFCVLLIVAVGSNMAFSWGNATHVYFANRLGVKVGQGNVNEMYGALLPDLFNYSFDTPALLAIADRLHNDPMAIVNNACNWHAKAGAYGFASHNQVWGADFTAHIYGITIPDTGWVVMKGVELAPAIVPDVVPIFMALGIDQPTAEYYATLLAPQMGHDLVETAVDILLRRNLDPLVGARMALAAKFRSQDVVSLLAKTYATEDVPAPLIMGAEQAYRKAMMQYGELFCLPEQMLIPLLAKQTASVAGAFIAAALGSPDPIPVPPAIVEKHIRGAMKLVKDSYAVEVAKTLCFIDQQLHDHGVMTAPVWALWKEGEEGIQDLTQPVEYALEQNYPNPFNPSTTISYALSQDTRVTLKVYNSIGEEVATLVDQDMPAGRHEYTWNATNLASGVYFYRLSSGDFTSTKKLTLLK